MKKQTFATYDTEQAARDDMKRARKRKYTITYSDFWKCWVAWFNA